MRIPTILFWLMAMIGITLSAHTVRASPVDVNECSKHAVIVPLEPGSISKKLQSFIDKDPDLSRGRDGGGAYTTDIDNDGRKETVVKYHSGSGNYLALSIFSPKGETFEMRNIPNPSYFEDDGSFYSFEFQGPRNSETDELLTEVCGKTYISFSNDDSEDVTRKKRDSFLWENGKVDHACSEAWILYSQNRAAKFYQKKDFWGAETFLADISENCGTSEAPQAWFLASADLAVARYHLGDTAGCIKVVKKARASKNWDKLPKKTKEALEFNEHLCANAVHHPLNIAKSTLAQVCEAPRSRLNLGTRTLLDNLRAEVEGAQTCSQFEKIMLSKKQLDLSACGWNLGTVNLIGKMVHLEELKLSSDESNACGGVGEIQVSDWSTLNTLKLKKFSLQGPSKAASMAKWLKTQTAMTDLNLEGNFEGSVMDSETIALNAAINELKKNGVLKNIKFK